MPSSMKRAPLGAWAFVFACAGALSVGVGAGCVAKRPEGRECLFNDDCASPLVCSSSVCRAACRSDRDCPPTYLCSPSSSPEKNVCVPAATPAACASEWDCPSGSICASNQCWWQCSSDPQCATRSAGTCLLTRRLCSSPPSAQQQRENPRIAPIESDGGAGDGATSMDATVSEDGAIEDGAQSSSDARTDGGGALDAYVPDPCRDAGDCAFANASGRCVGGRCTLSSCMAGFENCDGLESNGCEASTRTDPEHCGACGARCNGAPNVAANQCVDGVCSIGACATGFSDCNNNRSDGCEVDTRTNVAHCGACGAACTDFTSVALGGQGTTCVAGRCGYTMCRAGRGDCDMDRANGCEVDLVTSAAHCGACGSACVGAANQRAACTSSGCARTCAAGFGDCNAMAMDGCEVALDADLNHCGACGRRCASTELCLNGTCAASPFAAGDATEVFDPVSSTTLTAGVHRFASVIIRPGVVVRVGSPGVLEIYSRGAIVVNGTIDVSGGRGGDGAQASMMTCGGGNGAGGETGTTVAGAAGVAGTLARGGASGLGAAGEGGIQNPATMGGAFGGGAGGASNIIASAGAGGGGYSGGGGGGGSAGCTFCAGGRGAGGATEGGVGGNGTSGGEGGLLANALYGGRDGVSGSAGGGGGGSIGSAAVMDLALVSGTFRPGSAGGGGGAINAMGSGMCAPALAWGGAGGGGSGGALRLASGTSITVSPTGALLANGGVGGDGSSGGGGGGGGGSGGVIALVAPAVTVTGTLSAAGGLGGRGAGPALRGNGGNGGLGRVFVSALSRACSLGGTFTPQLVAGCAETPSAGTPARAYIVHIR
jgi:hypothetical protein